MRILIATIVILVILTPVNAQFTEIYDSSTHTLILENKTYFKIEISPIYNYSSPINYPVKKIVYDPVSGTFSNTTLGNVSLRYYGVNVVEIKNLWSNGTVNIEISLAYRKELIDKVFTLSEGGTVTLPRDVDGNPGIYNLTLKVGDGKFELPTLEIRAKPQNVKIEFDSSKDYDNTVVIGDNAYVKVNAIGATSFNWEILGLTPTPNGSVSKGYNDEVWILINTTWLYDRYNLTPKTYSFHVSCDGLDSYKPIPISEPSISVTLDHPSIVSGKDVSINIYTNVVSTNSDLDGKPNKLYLAIVRGVYSGRVNVSNHTLHLPDSNKVPNFMMYINNSLNLSLEEDGSESFSYTIDAPGFENITYWTVIAVVVTDDDRGTSDYFYGVSYTFFKVVVPEVSIKSYIYEGGSTYESSVFHRDDMIQFKGYAGLPAKSGLLTPNYLYVFVEDGANLGISSQTYTLFGLKGTLEKAYILDESGKFETSVWQISPNASFKSYRVYAIITADGNPPREDNILNMTWINVSVVRPHIEVNIEEKVPPGSTLTINGWADSKYVYVYASDDVFANIPDNPKDALKIRTIGKGGSKKFVLVGYVKEDADVGEYSLFFYASDLETFDPKTCLAEKVVKFEVVPLDVSADNLTVIRGENDFITFHLNGELRCRVKYEFKVATGYTYTKTTYPFGMVYEGEKFVRGREFVILIPTHYNKNGLTTEMGYKAIPAGKYPLKLRIYSNATGRLMLERTFYVNVVDPTYDISTTNEVVNGKIVVVRGDYLSVKIKSNRKSYYDWIFFAIEGDLGVEKCGWLSVENGKIEIKINTEELKGQFFKFYLVDAMGSGNRKDVESKFDILPNDYDVVEMNGILCKVYKKNPYARSYLGDDDLTIVFEFEVIDNVTGHYTYLFSAVDVNGSIFVHSIYGKTNVFMDLNFNNAKDEDEPSAVANSSWVEFKVPSGVDCVKLVSDKPIVTFYRYSAGSDYKDLSYEYSPSFAGREFVVPFDGYAYISPIRSSLVEITYNGSVLGKKFVDVGEVWKVDVNGGYIIKSSGNVVVVLKCSSGEDYTWAVSLIPNSYAGQKIMLPPRIKVDGIYSDYKYIKQLAYVTYTNGTVEVLKLSNKPTMLNLKKPAVAYVFYDAYVRDFSNPVYSLKHHTLAFKVYPVDANGCLGVALSMLSPYKAKIEIDSNYDGIFENSTVVEGIYNEPTRTSTGVHTVELGMFKSDKPVMVYSVDVEKTGLSYAFTLTIPQCASRCKHYEYWFPLIVRGSESSIYVRGVYGNTHVFLDLNFNGVRDEDEPSAVVTNRSWFKFNVYWDCVRLIADKPVVAYYKFAENNLIQFSYSPEKGREFVVPFDGYAYITAVDSKTKVEVGNESYTVDVGKVFKVYVKGGDIVKSLGGDISVVLGSGNLKSWSWAVSLIPVSKYGRELMIPPVSNYKFTESQYVKTTVYLTYEDGSVESFIVNGSRLIKTDRPAAAYILFDAYVRCSNSDVCGKYEFVHYSLAFKVYPISELGTKGVAFTIVSPFDGNEIKIDQNYDGIFERVIHLNKGETLTIDGIFKSKYPVLVYYATPTTAFSYEPFEKGVIPVEKTPVTTVPTISTTTTVTLPTQKATITPTPRGNNLIESLNYILKAIENGLRSIFKGLLRSFTSLTQTINKIYKIKQIF
ncbi:hypothetical protein [Archaeoglobus sp.]